MTSVFPASATASRRTASLRTLTRVLCLAVAAGLVVGSAFRPQAAMWVPAVSPLTAIGSALATRSTSLATLMAVPIVAFCLWRRRAFCRHLCPVGLLADQADRIGLRMGGRPRRLPPVGSWLALAVLGGAAFGLPLLLWLDPLAMLTGAFGVVRSGWTAPAVVALALMATVLLLGLVWPGAWCSRLCPLGGFQDLLPVPRRSASGGPADAGNAVRRMSRRQWLRLGAGAAGAGGVAQALARVSLTAPGEAAGAACLRPPGARPEDRFLALCLRCGNCIRACPSGVIRAGLRSRRVLSLLAPRIEVRTDYCREDCDRCGHVCPSGAIERWRMPDKPRIAFGLARVNADWCLLSEDRECDICRRVCPYDAVRIEWNPRSYSRLPTIDPDRCTGCGACQVACPGTEDGEASGPAVRSAAPKAIRITARRARIAGVAPARSPVG